MHTATTTGRKGRSAQGEVQGEVSALGITLGARTSGGWYEEVWGGEGGEREREGLGNNVDAAC